MRTILASWWMYPSPRFIGDWRSTYNHRGCGQRLPSSSIYNVRPFSSSLSVHLIRILVHVTHITADSLPSVTNWYDELIWNSYKVITVRQVRSSLSTLTSQKSSWITLFHRLVWLGFQSYVEELLPRIAPEFFIRNSVNVRMDGPVIDRACTSVLMIWWRKPFLTEVGARHDRISLHLITGVDRT